MLKQKVVFCDGIDLLSLACKQIEYDIISYSKVSPSKDIAKNFNLLNLEEDIKTSLIEIEGGDRKASFCYGASISGARVFNAFSGNELLQSLEQLNIQSISRFPIILNVSTKSVSSPLSLKGEHSDIMYLLNTGCIIFFAKDGQEIYDFNIIGLKLAEKVNLPVVIAFDSFFTEKQKRKAHIFENDEDVKKFLGDYNKNYSILDMKNLTQIGSYINETDLINNRYNVYLAMEETKNILPNIFEEYENFSGRRYSSFETYLTKDADVILFLLGSSFEIGKEAVDRLRKDGLKVGVFTLKLLRPFFDEDIKNICKNTKILICLDRQEVFGFYGGNMTTEIKSVLQELNSDIKVLSRIYGIAGKEIYVKDIINIFNECICSLNGQEIKKFDYIGIYENSSLKNEEFKNLKPEKIKNDIINYNYNKHTKEFEIDDININNILSLPKKISSGHNACLGCSIPVNLNLLLSAIDGYVVLLFQTGCSAIISSPYPKSSFKVNYVHNLFKNGASTLAGISEVFKEKQKRGEIDKDEEITFIMISGEKGISLSIGDILSNGIKNYNMIIFEYDNECYMNIDTQFLKENKLNEIEKHTFAKNFFKKDNMKILKSINLPYLATLSETNINDFLKKCKKAQEYSKRFGLVYLKCLSSCHLKWGNEPKNSMKIVEKAINSCYYPLYEIEQGKTKINYNPELENKKIPIKDWLIEMKKTNYLKNEKYSDFILEIQNEIDLAWENLKKDAK